MARDDKKRQKQLQRKAAKRKQVRRTLAQSKAMSGRPALSKARLWPLHEIIITENWREPMTLIQILIARKGPQDQYAIGNILVDSACLGVKNAYGRVTDSVEYYETRKRMMGNQNLVPADANLIAKIVRDSVAYARDLGFRPNRDLPQALMVLGKADPDACDIEIPLGGEDGKPYYFAGPYDDYKRIVNKLTKAVGPDGFDAVVPLGPPDMFEDDEEDW